MFLRIDSIPLCSSFTFTKRSFICNFEYLQGIISPILMFWFKVFFALLHQKYVICQEFRLHWISCMFLEKGNCVIFHKYEWISTLDLRKVIFKQNLCSIAACYKHCILTGNYEEFVFTLLWLFLLLVLHTWCRSEKWTFRKLQSVLFCGQ